MRIVDDDLRRAVASWLAPWSTLTPDEREHLLDLTEALLDGLHWEAANGFELTDDMCVCIAAHAAEYAPPGRVPSKAGEAKMPPGQSS